MYIKSHLLLQGDVSLNPQIKCCKYQRFQVIIRCRILMVQLQNSSHNYETSVISRKTTYVVALVTWKHRKSRTCNSRMPCTWLSKPWGNYTHTGARQSNGLSGSSCAWSYFAGQMTKRTSYLLVVQGGEYMKWGPIILLRVKIMGQRAFVVMVGWIW